MTDIDDIDLSGVEHRPCPKRGVLVFWDLPSQVQRLEDGTLENDSAQRHWLGSRVRIRSATDTERLLLTHLAYTLPTNLQTHVHWLSDGVRRRVWPQILETMEGLDPL
jgi:hypothetical protein